MKRTKKRPQPNYVRKLHYLWRVGAIPRDPAQSLHSAHRVLPGTASLLRRAAWALEVAQNQGPQS